MHRTDLKGVKISSSVSKTRKLCLIGSPDCNSIFSLEAVLHKFGWKHVNSYFAVLYSAPFEDCNSIFSSEALLHKYWRKHI